MTTMQEPKDHVERARAALHEMRVEYADMVAEDGNPDPDPEARFLAGLVQLLEMAVDDAAGVEAMNERTRQRADRVGGDGHTWVMHRREWSVALEVVDAWEDAHRSTPTSGEATA